MRAVNYKSIREKSQILDGEIELANYKASRRFV